MIGKGPAQLFCHTNKTVSDLGFDDILSVIKVSSQSLVIIGSTRSSTNESLAKLGVKLVEKNTLRVLSGVSL